jgi:hypothetical protein
MMLPKSKAILRTVLVLLTTPTVLAVGQSSTLPESANPRIAKIAEFTAREHSTILFTLGGTLLGYAKDGSVKFIHSPQNIKCQYPRSALSHDGLHIAFVSESDANEGCRIVVYDLSTGARRTLVEIPDDPGEMVWSWDDSDIAFLKHGISSVSVKDGSKKTLAIPIGDLEGKLLFITVGNTIQGLHKGEAFVAELNVGIPEKRPGVYKPQYEVFVVRDGDVHSLGFGHSPAVSPISNQIAYYSREGIVAINSDGTGRVVLSRQPLIGGFPNRGIVWSPDGSRLLCGALESENGNDSVYMVDVKSGHRERFLSHTSIMIKGWN